MFTLPLHLGYSSKFLFSFSEINRYTTERTFANLILALEKSRSKAGQSPAYFKFSLALNWWDVTINNDSKNICKIIRNVKFQIYEKFQKDIFFLGLHKVSYRIILKLFKLVLSRVKISDSKDDSNSDLDHEIPSDDEKNVEGFMIPDILFFFNFEILSQR